MKGHSAHSFLIALTLLLGSTCLSQANPGIESLERRSPFVPYDYKGGPGDNNGWAPSELQFRGIFELNGTTEFSLFDVKNKKSTWVALNETTGPYTIENYNPSEQTLSLSINGSPHQLKLSTPDGQPIPIAYQKNPRPTALAENKDKEAKAPSATMGEEEAKKAREESSRRVYDAFKRYIQEKRKRQQQ